MKYYTYEAHITLEDEYADEFAHHLWHFQKAFPALCFEINGVDFGPLSKNDLETALKEDVLKDFLISVSDTDESYPLKLIDALNLSLIDFSFQLSFVPVG